MNRRDASSQPLRRQVFPAHAGMNRGLHDRRRRYVDVFPAHAGMNRSVTVGSATCHGVFPAHAGMNRSLAPGDARRGTVFPAHAGMKCSSSTTDHKVKIAALRTPPSGIGGSAPTAGLLRVRPTAPVRRSRALRLVVLTNLLDGHLPRTSLSTSIARTVSHD